MLRPGVMVCVRYARNVYNLLLDLLLIRTLRALNPKDYTSRKWTYLTLEIIIRATIETVM